MGRGEEGDLRRRRKGGRYTPPSRNRTPDQPVRVQVAAHPASTADKQPITASTKSTEIPPIEQLPLDDQVLLSGLIGKIRGAESTTDDGHSPKETAFHEAVSSLNEYILDLRAKLDRGFREPRPSEMGNAWAKAEPSRPSVRRVQNLAYNFFDLPAVKKVSMGIHSQKLIAGFPYFLRAIASSTPSSRSLSLYFSDVTTLMADTLVSSLDKAKLDQYLKLGLTMGYRTAGMRWPVDPALRHFAGQGVGTFVEQLERVIRGAIADQVDPSERVRAELLDKDGTIHRLMRISFDRVNDAVADIKGRSIEDARRILAENDYSTGACPGLSPVDSVVDAESGAKRPIAFDYAMTIVRHIPPSVLQSA